MPRFVLERHVFDVAQTRRGEPVLHLLSRVAILVAGTQVIEQGNRALPAVRLANRRTSPRNRATSSTSAVCTGTMA